MEFSLTKTERLVTHAATEKGSKPVLCCAHIRKGAIEAADGFILVQRALPKNACKEDVECLLDAAQLAKHKDGKSMGKVVYVEQEDGKTIKASGEEEYTLEKQEGTFPQLDKIYPTESPVFQIALARSCLLKILKCLDKKEEIIKFSFYGEHLPAKFVVGYNDVKGLIMPMFVGGDGTW